MAKSQTKLRYFVNLSIRIFSYANESFSELISLDKATRNILGKSFYPITIWCDNISATENTEKEGSHKLKDFDDLIEVIQENLKYREETGKRKQEKSHGDYNKYLVLKIEKIKVKYVNTKKNITDIMTKPSEFKSHQYLTKETLNIENRLILRPKSDPP